MGLGPGYAVKVSTPRLRRVSAPAHRGAWLVQRHPVRRKRQVEVVVDAGGHAAGETVECLLLRGARVASRYGGQDAVLIHRDVGDW